MRVVMAGEEANKSELSREVVDGQGQSAHTTIARGRRSWLAISLSHCVIRKDSMGRRLVIYRPDGWRGSPVARQELHWQSIRHGKGRGSRATRQKTSLE